MQLKKGLLVVPALAVFALAGCSVTVSQGDLEESLTSELQAESVECEEGLEGEVDFSTECTAHAGDQSQTYVVTVTEVDGGEVGYDAQPA